MISWLIGYYYSMSSCFMYSCCFYMYNKFYFHLLCIVRPRFCIISNVKNLKMISNGNQEVKQNHKNLNWVYSSYSEWNVVIEFRKIHLSHVKMLVRMFKLSARERERVFKYFGCEHFFFRLKKKFRAHPRAHKKTTSKLFCVLWTKET